MTQRFHGENLRLIRQFWSLSLSDVADRISTSRQYVHQIEVEDKFPSDATISALASTLAVLPTFFATTIKNSIKVEHGHFRKLQTTPVSVTHEVLAYCTIFELLIRKLEEYAEFPTKNIPSLHADTGEEAEVAADRCRAHWSLGINDPISSITRAAENNGVIVALFDHLSSKVDAFSLGRARPIIVRITRKESLFRQRFDIAHELGHLVMHEGMQTGDHASESLANRFASAILLPRYAFLRDFPRRGRIDWHRVFDLKLKWGVSAAAIIRRALDLGVIGEVEYRRANIHLANTGQKRVEPYDTDYSTEEPEVLRKAVTLILDGGFASSTSIAESLHLRPFVLRRLLSFTTSDQSDGQYVGDEASPANVHKLKSVDSN